VVNLRNDQKAPQYSPRYLGLAGTETGSPRDIVFRAISDSLRHK
jgi:hypothetical protein